jgi:hypothetical protein
VKNLNETEKKTILDNVRTLLDMRDVEIFVQMDREMKRTDDDPETPAEDGEYEPSGAACILISTVSEPRIGWGEAEDIKPFVRSASRE